MYRGVQSRLRSIACRRLRAFSANLAAPAFSPSGIAGLSLWLKADSLALNDDDLVAAWADSSGNGNNAAQSTAGNKPKYKTNIFGALPAVLSDGVDDFMTIADAAGLRLSSGSFCIFASVKFVAQDGFNWLCEKGQGDNTNEDYIIGLSGGDKWRSLCRQSIAEDATGVTGLATATPYVLTSQRSVSGSFSKIFVNGTEDKSIALAGSSGEGADALTILARVGGLQSLNGYLQELLIYKADLSVDSRAQVEGYMNGRVGAF